ncbi:hypothetical protein [Blastococcus sp. SYSU D00695]
MTLGTTPVPARTDVPAPDGAPPRPLPPGAVRGAGIAVTTGSAAWAVCILAFGLGDTEGAGLVVYGISGLLFQVGLVALVAVQRRTGATGTGRLARGFLHAEHVLLGLAILSSLQTIVVPAWDDHPAALALDACWPLSMLGMFAIGIRIAVAGRWRGAARFWPLGAESWAPVCIPVSGALPDVAPYVAAGHLLVGYAVLGVVLALRPELTVPRP